MTDPGAARPQTFERCTALHQQLSYVSTDQKRPQKAAPGLQVVCHPDKYHICYVSLTSMQQCAALRYAALLLSVRSTSQQLPQGKAAYQPCCFSKVVTFVVHEVNEQCKWMHQKNTNLKVVSAFPCCFLSACALFASAPAQSWPVLANPCYCALAPLPLLCWHTPQLASLILSLAGKQRY